MSVVLVDTGALVAMIDRRERFHGWATEQLRTLRAPLLTCEAVLAETCFLLAGHPAGPAAVRAGLKSNALRVDLALASEWESVFSLMERYADQPMSFADGCLVRMSERHADSTVFTLDRHFHAYRRNRRQRIPLIIPAEI